MQHALPRPACCACRLCSQLAGLAFGAAHVALLPPPSRLRPAILAATAVGNVGSLPLAMVLSLVRSPHLALGAHGGDAADMAVCYIMLGWFYATLVQMPMGAPRLATTPAGTI